MKEGPDIARVAALVGEPARANMLTALMVGKALTATELAAEAGVSVQTASSHLGKLTAGGLLVVRKQGRHRYYALAHEDVAQMLESLMGLAAGQGMLRSRTGPKDAALREARVCYNHLAGRRGVQMYRAMLGRGALVMGSQGLVPSDAGAAWLQAGLGLDLNRIEGRSPMCRECLDWSERDSHLAGRLGRALLAQMETLGWAARDPHGRAVRFTSRGNAEFDRVFRG